MGMGIFDHLRSASSYDKVSDNKFSNPDPANYVIKKQFYRKGYLLVDIVYPDCTNYEGRKFLLYKGVTPEDLIKQKTIDPHFSENKDFYSPIARFEPTEDGWDMGIDFIVSQIVKHYQV